jgi:hypothetical protein
MIRFDDLTREERYYSATMLPYLLAFDRFRGLNIFEQYLAQNVLPRVLPESDPSQVQLLTEVFLDRDLPYYGIPIPAVAFESKRSTQSKPDLLILTSKSLYLFECKVFAPGSEYQLHDQIMKQKYVLDIVESVVGHAFDNKVHFLVLPHKYDIPDCVVLTWGELFDLFSPILPGDDYFIQRFGTMIRRLSS